jgi:hypothetical protein
MSPFYQNAFSFLLKRGQQTYGKFFTIYKDDIPIVGKLIAWFVHDEETAGSKGIDPDKGILLSGPVGCGKTSLMNLMSFFTEEPSHKMKACRDIAFEFQKNGFEVIHRYAGHSWLPNNPTRAICFDDLGTEQSLKHFGQECNVMAEIILSRYERFIRHRQFTHFTTNLSADEIEEIYGPRVRSRLREMCNLIAFPRDTPDKRK